MLLRFYIKNYRSIKDEIEFYMIPGKYYMHPNHLARSGNRKILKSSFIYGANAAGKTNFVRAMDFMRKVVLMGLRPIRLDNLHFRLAKEANVDSGIFQIEIFSGGHFYSYGFAVSYMESRILEEWLYQCDNNNEVCVFLRGVDDKGERFCRSDWNFSEEEKKRFSVYSEGIRTKSMDGKIFLKDIVDHIDSENNEFLPFFNVMEWFKRLIVIFPNSRYSGINRLVQNDSSEQLAHWLNYFDTGIENVKVVKENFEDLDNLPPGLISMIRNQLIDVQRNNKINGAKILLKSENDLIEVEKKKGNLFVNKVGSDHGNPDDLFDYQDESDGTKRLFDLLPLYQTVYKSPVIMIDEIDRSLHTMATRKFIEKFYDASKGNSAQLIATLQDSNILDLDFIRPDEIWFVERGVDHGTRMYPLTKFRLKVETNFGRDYLLGRYGAIPIFNDSRLDTCGGSENVY